MKKRRALIMYATMTKNTEDVCDAVEYELADGTKVPGTYFFHYNNNEKPGSREEAKAKAFIADIVEDYFMTYDGEPFPPFSQVISIS